MQSVLVEVTVFDSWSLYKYFYTDIYKSSSRLVLRVVCITFVTKYLWETQMHLWS